MQASPCQGETSVPVSGSGTRHTAPELCAASQPASDLLHLPLAAKIPAFPRAPTAPSIARGWSCGTGVQGDPSPPITPTLGLWEGDPSPCQQSWQGCSCLARVSSKRRCSFAGGILD